jgi:hypothetical protein
MLIRPSLGLAHSRSSTSLLRNAPVEVLRSSTRLFAVAWFSRENAIL